MEEVKQHHRNLAVAFYDYKKAYDKVHHDWMIHVYDWIGIPRNVIRLIVDLVTKWKTRLEVWNGNEKMTSRWIRILCGFLQGDSYSPVESLKFRFAYYYYYYYYYNYNYNNQILLRPKECNIG